MLGAPGAGCPVSWAERLGQIRIGAPTLRPPLDRQLGPEQTPVTDAGAEVSGRGLCEQPDRGRLPGRLQRKGGSHAR